MKREAALRHKLNRVVDYVQQNCGASVGLEQMADIACLSKYHFTRVFKKHLRETPYRYLNRTRLELAARSLAYNPDKSITNVAMESGFSETQAFSNAFRQRFQTSPTAFRSHKDRLTDGHDKPGVVLDELEKIRVDIVNMPTMRLAYVRNFGPYRRDDGAISQLSVRIVDWAMQQKLWSPNTLYVGMCPSNPVITPPQACIYDASIVVPEDIGEDDLVSIQIVPGGRYAVLKIACTIAQLKQVWRWLASRWLPQSGEAYAMENSYLIYQPRQYGVIAPELGVQVCLRLLPRSFT